MHDFLEQRLDDLGAALQDAGSPAPDRLVATARRVRRGRLGRRVRVALSVVAIGAFIGFLLPRSSAPTTPSTPSTPTTTTMTTTTTVDSASWVPAPADSLGALRRANLEADVCCLVIPDPVPRIRTSGSGEPVPTLGRL